MTRFAHTTKGRSWYGQILSLQFCQHFVIERLDGSRVTMSCLLRINAKRDEEVSSDDLHLAAQPIPAFKWFHKTKSHRCPCSNSSKCNTTSRRSSSMLCKHDIVTLLPSSRSITKCTKRSFLVCANLVAVNSHSKSYYTNANNLLPLLVGGNSARPWAM